MDFDAKGNSKQRESSRLFVFRQRFVDLSMDNNTDSEAILIYTIGHSNHSGDALLALLQQHSINCLVDGAASPIAVTAAVQQRNVDQVIANGTDPLSSHGDTMAVARPSRSL
ncbi:MAG: hypothetical protein R2932_49370 [Caldilineaceae bacterium]